MTKRCDAQRRQSGAELCLRRFVRDARGGTALEYAMIGALIFAVTAGTIRLYGSKLNDVYSRISATGTQIE